MSENIVPFDFAGDNVRTISIEGDPWFVAKDICTILGLANVSDSLSKLEDDEKGLALTDTPGGKQELATVSESGMYALVLRSRKPQAKAFRKWVTSEVLPAIRKTGTYSIPTTPTPPARQLAPQRDLIDYINAAKLVGLENSAILKPLFEQRMAEQMGGASSKVEHPIVLTVRAQELGISSKDIGTGSQLGKWIKAQGFEPLGKSHHGRYQINVYSPSPELDRAIVEFFAEDAIEVAA